MSFPNIPDVDPKICITREQSITLLLCSIAFEELGLSHLINAEAEKIQFVLGTLKEERRPMPPHKPPTFEEILKLNESVEKMLRNVIKTEMLLQFKLEDTSDLGDKKHCTGYCNG